MKDPRKRRGIRHRQVSILAVAACAVLAGCSSYVAIGQWAADLSQDLLKRLGCKYHEDRKQYIAPSEPTIRRTLQSVDADEMDQAASGIAESVRWIARKAERALKIIGA